MGPRVRVLGPGFTYSRFSQHMLINMCYLSLREFQTIKALAITNFNISPVYYDIRIHA